MALLAIQLVRVVIISSLFEFQIGPAPPNLVYALDLVITIHQALNVIIRSVLFSYLLMTFFTCLLGHRTNINFGTGLDEIVLP